MTLCAVLGRPDDPVGDVGVGRDDPVLRVVLEDAARRRSATSTRGPRSPAPLFAAAAAIPATWVPCPSMSTRVARGTAADAGRSVRRHVRRKIAVRRLDAGVDDADGRAGGGGEAAGEEVPARERRDRRQRPLHAEPGIVRRAEGERAPEAVRLRVPDIPAAVYSASACAGLWPGAIRTTATRPLSHGRRRLRAPRPSRGSRPGRRTEPGSSARPRPAASGPARREGRRRSAPGSIRHGPRPPLDSIA